MAATSAISDRAPGVPTIASLTGLDESALRSPGEPGRIFGMRWLILLLCVSAACERSAPVTPTLQNEHAIRGVPGAQLVVMQAWVLRAVGSDGVNRIIEVARADVDGPAPGPDYELRQFAAYVMLERGVNLQRVLCICDYPPGFVGPLPCGHCREDGTGCGSCDPPPPSPEVAPYFFRDPAFR